jgi:nucleoside-diphosphate-sugar epimerase
VFVSALEAASDDVVPAHPIDVGNREPLRVLDVAHAVQRFVPTAVIESVPMRAGEPEGGPLSTPQRVKVVQDAVMEAMPALDRIAVNRAVKQLGTVVSANVETLHLIGVTPDAFMPLAEGIERTVNWFRENEGVTWRSPN